MGTTLTGTTPQDTYDSLIKVTDNGPLSGSLKKLTDGLGNDSSLSLSTAAASIAGTLDVTGNATFDTNTLFVDAANNRVGVGTITPVTALDINGEVSVAFNATYGARFYNQDKNNWSFIGNSVPTGGTGANLRIGDATGEVMRITGGNVGIGTSNPTQKLHVASTGISRMTIENTDNQATGAGIQMVVTNAGVAVGNATMRVDNTDNIQFFNFGGERLRIQSGGGISFNGDSAAANALDDYEEGTWTMGVAFGGAAVGVTTSENTGTYTKIGRQVTVNGYLQLTSKGSSVGSATITGLPFTIANSNSNYSAVSLWFLSITYDNQFFAIGTINTTTISLQESTILGVNSSITDADFANNSGIVVSLTYFV